MVKNRTNIPTPNTASGKKLRYRKSQPPCDSNSSCKAIVVYCLIMATKVESKFV